MSLRVCAWKVPADRNSSRRTNGSPAFHLDESYALHRSSPRRRRRRRRRCARRRRLVISGGATRRTDPSGRYFGSREYTRYIIIMGAYYIVIMPPEPFSKTVSEISDRPKSLISAGESPYHLNSTSSDHLVIRFISPERDKETTFGFGVYHDARDVYHDSWGYLYIYIPTASFTHYARLRYCTKICIQHIHTAHRYKNNCKRSPISLSE